MTSAQKQMADAKFYESYSRYLHDEDRYETWEEAVSRVMNVHRIQYKDKMTPELTELIDYVQKAYEDKQILAAQRSLQFGGEQLLKQNSKLYNCTATYVDRVDFFKEGFFLMLSGCGIGFSVQTHHVAKLPGILPRNDGTISFTVEDSIEGWADSIGALVESYMQVDSQYFGKKIYFDTTQVRPKGAEISGGFKAPGPEPLKKALELIQTRFIAALSKGQRLSTLDIYDITMYIADAVISGGVRRAASICLFSKTDTEMLNAKTGNWFIDNPQRGRRQINASMQW